VSLILPSLLLLSNKHAIATAAFLYNPKPFSRPSVRLPLSSLSSSSSNTGADDDIIKSFTGPTILNDNAEIQCSLELQELGLVISVAESSVATGTLGLFARISDDADETTLPAMTLLAGYAKGTFHDEDQGDKTVGFSIFSTDAPVFFNRQLMTIQEAMAACCTSDIAVRVAGHDVYYDEEDDKVVVWPTNNEPFARYFVPNSEDEMNVTNFGQYCNDRAFQIGMASSSSSSSMDQDDTTDTSATTETTTTDEYSYKSRCESENCVRLAWRLEFDQEANMLKPSWPVSILSRDLKFSNRELMELGTTYGWNYWNATIELDRL